MKRVLILPAQDVTLCSVSRCLALAEGAIRAGHVVGFVADEVSAKWFRHGGGPIFDSPLPKWEQARTDTMRVVSVADYAEVLGLIEPCFLEGSVRAEELAIASFRPDVLLSDLRMTASVSAAQSGLPLVSIGTWPLDPRNPENAHTEGDVTTCAHVNEFLARHGCPTVMNIAELCFRRAQRVVVPSIPRLEPFADPTGLEFVGSLISEQLECGPLQSYTWHQFPIRVFVYLSNSNLDELAVYRSLCEAFDGTEVGVLVSMGMMPTPDAVLPPRTANVEFAWFCPGCAALRQSHVFIYHGGQNSTIATMLTGTPAVAIPFDSTERRHNAEQLVGLGAGMIMEADDVSSRRLRDVVRCVGDAPSFRLNAERASAMIRALGGADRAIALVESLTA